MDRLTYELAGESVPDESTTISALAVGFRASWLAYKAGDLGIAFNIRDGDAPVDESETSLEVWKKTNRLLSRRALYAAGPLLLKTLQMGSGDVDGHTGDLRDALARVPPMPPGWVLVQLGNCSKEIFVCIFCGVLNSSVLLGFSVRRIPLLSSESQDPWQHADVSISFFGSFVVVLFSL